MRAGGIAASVTPRCGWQALGDSGCRHAQRGLLVTTADHGGAILLAAFTLGEAALGPDHRDTAYWRNDLGHVLQGLGDLEGPGRSTS